MRLLSILTLCLAVACAAAGTAHADPQQVAVGALRTPAQRTGAGLRGEPRMGAAIVAKVEHGTRLVVEAVAGSESVRWIRVRVAQAQGEARVGWLRASETVEPHALTGAGSTLGVQGVTGARVDAREQSAAARGFGPGIEARAAASDAQLKAALAVVDARVEGVKPTPEQVAAFARQGRLGLPGVTR